jgi:AAA lid domain
MIQRVASSEEHHGVTITDSAIVATATLSNRYITVGSAREATQSRRRFRKAIPALPPPH